MIIGRMLVIVLFVLCPVCLSVLYVCHCPVSSSLSCMFAIVLYVCHCPVCLSLSCKLVIVLYVCHFFNYSAALYARTAVELDEKVLDNLAMSK